MHTNSVFDELELVEKLATRSETSHIEIPRSKNNRGVQNMQMIELPKMMRSSYPTEGPLDSAVIYPIIWSPINHLETVKRKTYQGHTFSLRILLDLDDKSSSSTQAEMPRLILMGTYMMC
jgi:hypothetical protein